MVCPDEKDCSMDRRIENALLYFTMPKYDETFILFTLDDAKDFDFDNIDEDRLRVAYIYKNPYCYAYLRPIDEIEVLRDVTDYVREYLYERYPVMVHAHEVGKQLREVYEDDSSNIPAITRMSFECFYEDL